MAWRFQKHYTRDEARALLPQIRGWLQRLNDLRQDLAVRDQRLAQMQAGGKDIGGPTVNEWVKTLCQMKTVLQEFRTRQIQLKDLDRGLVDFPTLRGGKEVFLCWEQDEDDIEFWHELDTGYAGRERL